MYIRFIYPIAMYIFSFRFISMKTYKSILVDFWNKVRLDYHKICLKLKNTIHSNLPK